MQNTMKIMLYTWTILYIESMLSIGGHEFQKGGVNGINNSRLERELSARSCGGSF
jgi:hypothetical protein